MRFIFTVFLLIVFSLEAAEQKICLNMIVKNESQVIKRCLNSVKPFIHYWVIVDTGSNDGTQAIIKEFMKDIPGELHEKPWKNFEHNRNEALEFAKKKGDYIMLMDADDQLVYNEDYKLPALSLDCYNSIINLSSLQYDRPLLIKNALDWKWYGVLHEYLSCQKPISSTRLENIRKISLPDGVRSQDTQKYQKDALFLENALKDDPANSRYVFYLAQSFRDAGDYASSLKNYKKRVEMGGWDEEVFYSKLQIGRMKEMLNFPSDEIVKSYYDAYYFRPSRAEPLYYLAEFLRKNNDCPKAYLVASMGADLPVPHDKLFLEKWAYDFGLKFERSISAYWIGKYDECQALCKELLSMSELPESIREAVERNIVFAIKKRVELLQDPN